MVAFHYSQTSDSSAPQRETAPNHNQFICRFQTICNNPIESETDSSKTLRKQAFNIK